MPPLKAVISKLKEEFLENSCTNKWVTNNERRRISYTLTINVKIYYLSHDHKQCFSRTCKNSQIQAHIFLTSTGNAISNKKKPNTYSILKARLLYIYTTLIFITKILNIFQWIKYFKQIKQFSSIIHQIFSLIKVIKACL